MVIHFLKCIGPTEHMFKKLINFLFKKDKFKNIVIVESGKSVQIPSKTMALTKKGNMFTWLRYKCPCGCGETISLSLSPKLQPYWAISISKDKNKRPLVTITPSVYMCNTKCGSHYFITENKVIWCK